jgi:hypothetical protein
MEGAKLIVHYLRVYILQLFPAILAFNNLKSFCVPRMYPDIHEQGTSLYTYFQHELAFIESRTKPFA